MSTNTMARHEEAFNVPLQYRNKAFTTKKIHISVGNIIQVSNGLLVSVSDDFSLSVIKPCVSLPIFSVNL